MVSLLRRRSKGMNDILGDASWWDEQGAIINEVLEPALREAFVAGAEMAAEGAGLAFNVDEINTASIRYIRSYTSSFWETLSNTRREALREALITASESGLTPRQVADLLRPFFDADRALTIATTEMTTVMGQGAVEQFKVSGFGRWEWAISADERVCPVCLSLDGERFPVSKGFQAAHVLCRCRAIPVEEFRA